MELTSRHLARWPDILIPQVMNLRNFAMYDTPTDPFSFSTDAFTICRSLQSSDAPSIYEVMLNNNHNKRYCLKGYYDNGGPGSSKKGRDLHGFRCELKAL
ncbi:hypothetical protein BO99DRAFT_456105 [Aspergillus violaceofuscus CBS 115571]|uniref:Uncharacterized protein n=1 Tax=Aspergillus violaceofuscus (strain CBS 115571) TaxID=1450538 RepID=A0A2V5H977_ASPV1|nr:hypothetical protein BO99DRAFT_456105 [Aspergillus violaceofuscus CBS 115571]